MQLTADAFRARDWWRSKAALLMGMVYLFTVWFAIPFADFIPLAVLSLTTIIGFASAGYLFNDLFDIRQDLIAGKKNFLAGKSKLIISLLFLTSFLFILCPWIILPADGFSYTLIAVELLLFIVYSIPPIRLKERGIAGVAVDSLYAHALPPVLAAYTFSLAAGRPFPGFELLFLFAWQFTSGTRNILMHQIEDAAADRASGSKNYAGDMTNTGFTITIRYLIILEIFQSIIFFILLSRIVPAFAACATLIMVLAAIILIRYRSGGIPALFAGTSRYFPNNISERWLPPLYLVIAGIYHWGFIVVLLLHLLLFNVDVYVRTANRIWVYISFIYAIIYKVLYAAGSAIVNYPIYYVFLALGVDLRKENVSALTYIRNKRKK